MDLMIIHNMNSGGSICTGHTFAFWIFFYVIAILL